MDIHSIILWSVSSETLLFSKVWGQGAEMQTLFEIFVDISVQIVYYSFCRQTTMREWLSGGAPPCQGGGRGFDPRLALLFLRNFRNGDRVSAPLRSALNACHWHAAPLAGSVCAPLRSALLFKNGSRPVFSLLIISLILRL